MEPATAALPPPLREGLASAEGLPVLQSTMSQQCYQSQGYDQICQHYRVCLEIQSLGSWWDGMQTGRLQGNDLVVPMRGTCCSCSLETQVLNHHMAHPAKLQGLIDCLRDTC